jgi:hypothetical protein
VVEVRAASTQLILTIASFPNVEEFADGKETGQFTKET